MCRTIFIEKSSPNFPTPKLMPTLTFVRTLSYLTRGHRKVRVVRVVLGATLTKAVGAELMDQFFPLEPPSRQESTTGQPNFKDELLSSLYQDTSRQPLVSAEAGDDIDLTLAGQSYAIVKQLDTVSTDNLHPAYARVLQMAGELVGVEAKDILTAVTSIENRVLQRRRDFTSMDATARRGESKGRPS
jgi:hypothetical protein